MRLEHFEGSAFLEVPVRQVMQRVTVRAHPEMTDDGLHQWGAEVIVTLGNGKVLASRIDDYKRRGPGGDPMRREELWAKFKDCAGLTLPRSQVAPLFALLEKLDALPDLAEVSRLLTCRSHPVAGAAA